MSTMLTRAWRLLISIRLPGFRLEIRADGKSWSRGTGSRQRSGPQPLGWLAVCHPAAAGAAKIIDHAWL